MYHVSVPGKFTIAYRVLSRGEIEALLGFEYAYITTPTISNLPLYSEVQPIIFKRKYCVDVYKSE